MKESPGRLPWGFKVMRKYLRRSPKQPDGIQNRELRNKKWLRRTAIGFRYRPSLAAYPPDWVHRAVSPNQNRQKAEGLRLPFRPLA